MQLAISTTTTTFGCCSRADLGSKTTPLQSMGSTFGIGTLGMETF
jgi:hypothetical protein